MKKDYENYILYGILVLVIAILIFSLFSFFGFSKTDLTNQEQNMGHTKMNRMSLTSFDSQLARQFMDKNNDGKCDACGMDVNLCIESGQLQCNMDPKSTIGILGSAHMHADFKVYINGKPINFANSNYYMKSSFIHVDDNQNKEDASGVIHIHATGVPLWIFFKSLDMDFTSECFKFEDKQYCNNFDNKLRLFINGIESNQFENYIIKNMDKILISYGNEDEIKQQLNSITDYAKN